VWSNPGESGAGRESNGADDDGDGLIDDTTGWDWAAGDNQGLDENGHGTHVSGTIAGRAGDGTGVAGVAWRARLMALRVLDETGSGRVSDAIKAYGYAAAHGARIVNASLGGGSFSRAERDAIAAARDVLFVVAAGNEGAENDTPAPTPSPQTTPGSPGPAAPAPTAPSARPPRRSPRLAHRTASPPASPSARPPASRCARRERTACASRRAARSGAAAAPAPRRRPRDRPAAAPHEHGARARRGAHLDGRRDRPRRASERDVTAAPGPRPHRPGHGDRAGDRPGRQPANPVGGSDPPGTMSRLPRRR
jgi:hypothetical protein